MLLEHLRDKHAEILNICGFGLQELLMVLILGPCLFQLFLKGLSSRNFLLYELVLGVQFRLIFQALLLQELDPAILLENLLLHR